MSYTLDKQLKEANKTIEKWENEKLDTDEFINEILDIISETWHRAEQEQLMRIIGAKA